MGRYYGSEALRNPKLQKKALDYALDKLNPMIQNVGSQALDQLSTKIRPKKNYKTNRKNLDGGSLDIHNAILKIAKKKQKKSGAGLLLGKNSPFKNVPLLNILL